MKTYTDAAQLPLAATVRKLPLFNDTQTLVADRPAVSPSVIGLKSIKVDKTVGNINGNYHSSLTVSAGHKNGNGGESGI
jgi:hypothetical protein